MQGHTHGAPFFAGHICACTRMLTHTHTHTHTHSCKGTRTVPRSLQVWCEWAEMELRHQNFRRALDIVKRATTMPPGRAHSRMTVEEERQLPVQQRLYRCARVCGGLCALRCGCASAHGGRAPLGRHQRLRQRRPSRGLLAPMRMRSCVLANLQRVCVCVRVLAHIVENSGVRRHATEYGH